MGDEWVEPVSLPGLGLLSGPGQPSARVADFSTERLVEYEADGRELWRRRSRDGDAFRTSVVGFDGLGDRVVPIGLGDDVVIACRRRRWNRQGCRRTLTQPDAQRRNLTT